MSHGRLSHPKQLKGGDPMSSEIKVLWCAEDVLYEVTEQPSRQLGLFYWKS